MSDEVFESRYSSEDKPRVTPDPELAAGCRDLAGSLQSHLHFAQGAAEQLDAALLRLSASGADSADIASETGLGTAHVEAVVGGQTSLYFLFRALVDRASGLA
ncbi:hypothetical protein [Arthrobacter sp. 2MCAF14]|uniref:hypothetical protein n=1 Tax=Arthrobacter sp. 2MCAF14 TaxID=3232982 RepID=UPI003F914B69